MKEVAHGRASRKRVNIDCVYGDQALRIFEKSMRKRAKRLLSGFDRRLSTRRIYELLAPLRSNEARALRAEMKTHYSFR